jgi:hypothetical protein
MTGAGCRSCQQAGAITRTGLIVIVLVCLVFVLAVRLLPRGFSDDLSMIGQGKAAVVLTHDKNSVRSMELMTLLNKVRADYSAGVEFLVIDIDSSTGREFIRRQGIAGVGLLFFDTAGIRRAVLDRRVNEVDLRRVLSGL